MICRKISKIKFKTHQMVDDYPYQPIADHPDPELLLLPSVSDDENDDEQIERRRHERNAKLIDFYEQRKSRLLKLFVPVLVVVLVFVTTLAMSNSSWKNPYAIEYGDTSGGDEKSFHITRNSGRSVNTGDEAEVAIDSSSSSSDTKVGTKSAATPTAAAAEAASQMVCGSSCPDNVMQAQCVNKENPGESNRPIRFSSPPPFVSNLPPPLSSPPLIDFYHCPPHHTPHLTHPPHLMPPLSPLTHPHPTPHFFSVMGGLDFVQYFSFPDETYTGEVGSSQYQATYQGHKFYFLNEENQKQFENNPGRYAPMWGGFCSYGVSTEYCPDYYWSAECLGPDGNWGLWTIQQDHLFFFYLDEVKQKFLENPEKYIMDGSNRWKGWFPTTVAATGTSTATGGSASAAAADASTMIFNTDCFFTQAGQKHDKLSPQMVAAQEAKDATPTSTSSTSSSASTSTSTSASASSSTAASAAIPSTIEAIYVPDNKLIVAMDTFQSSFN